MKIITGNVNESEANSFVDSLPFILNFFSEITREIVHQVNLEIFRPIAPNQLNQVRNEPAYKIEHADMYNAVSHLHSIPILLKKTNSENCENGKVDLLGAYIPSPNQSVTPWIELYVDEILAATSNDPKHNQYLFTKVLLHELMHAAMDVNNQGLNWGEKEKYNTEYGKWREESFANAGTLFLIKHHGNEEFYQYSKNFMLSQQPPEYKLGVIMSEMHLPHDFYWRVRSKMQDVDDKIKEAWLKYVKGNNITIDVLEEFENIIIYNNVSSPLFKRL